MLIDPSYIEFMQYLDTREITKSMTQTLADSIKPNPVITSHNIQKSQSESLKAKFSAFSEYTTLFKITFKTPEDHMNAFKAFCKEFFEATA